MISVKHFFDPETFTLSYIVFDEKTKDAVIIDPVLDFEQATGTITDQSNQLITKFILENKLSPHAVLETHAHADHLSSSQLLKKIYPHIKIGISERIKVVQEVFKNHFHIDYVRTDGSQFDLLFKDFEVVQFGALTMKILPTPGHTPACSSYLFENIVFTGDALFLPDSGTGRCDFPKGSAKNLYDSITKNLYSLPDDTVFYTGHDYSPNGREMRYQSTIGESKQENIQLKASTSEEEYIKFRETRDATLKAPRLLLPSIQINIDAGHLPPREDDGKSYLKLPLGIKIKSAYFN